MAEIRSQRHESPANGDQPYSALLKESELDIEENLHLLTKELATADEDAYRRWTWGIASARLRSFIANYSGGRPASDLVANFPTVLGAIESAVLTHPKYRTEPLHLDELDAYAYAMWLLSLAKLLRLDHLVPRVAALFDVDGEDNRGQDALYETLLDKLGIPRRPAAKCYQQLKAHPLLLEATQVDPSKRAKLVEQFLDKWYPAMKACYWHGTHTKVPQNFFGYWAFEAGLVTYLWDIDDTSYRDMPFYPKDLVAYARRQQAKT